MARVTICKKDFLRELPTVCAVCGEYAGHLQAEQFGPSRLGVYLTLCLPWVCCCSCALVVDVLLGFIFMSHFPTATLEMPVCESHTRHWVNRRLLSWACVASTWVSLAAGMFSLSLKIDVFNQFALIGTCVCWVAAWVLLVILDQTGVRADDVLSDRVILAGVYPVFAAAVEDADPGE